MTMTLEKLNTLLNDTSYFVTVKTNLHDSAIVEKSELVDHYYNREDFTPYDEYIRIHYTISDSEYSVDHIGEIRLVEESEGLVKVLTVRRRFEGTGEAQYGTMNIQFYKKASI